MQRSDTIHHVASRAGECIRAGAARCRIAIWGGNGAARTTLMRDRLVLILGIASALEQVLLLATGVLGPRLMTEHTLHRQTLWP